MASEDVLHTPPRWRSEANADLTDSTGGVVDGTLDAAGDTTVADQSAVINNNFADVANELAELKAALRKAGFLAE